MPGERLPSTRTLADSLKLARGTVSEVFDQLIAEGYLEAKVGSGTRVSRSLDNIYKIQLNESVKIRRSKAKLPKNIKRYAKIAEDFIPSPQTTFLAAVPQGIVGINSKSSKE